MKLFTNMGAAGLLLCLSLAATNVRTQPAVQPQQIALTFERLPAASPLGYWRPREVSSLILRVLGRHQIQSIGFVVEEKIDDDSAGFFVLDDWALKGHLLGNNTYSFVDFNQLNVDDFIAHIADGQKYIRRAAQAHSTAFRFFRFPLLHEGDEKRKWKEMRQILYRNGYVTIPVTVKTADYRYSQPYLDAEGEAARQDRIKAEYLDHISQCLDYAEAQSQTVFERVIPQIMQLQLGIASGVFLEDLIQLLKQRGYEFITVTEALEDPAYQTEETYVGPLGLSFTDRVAATRGIPFKENPWDADFITIAPSED